MAFNCCSNVDNLFTIFLSHNECLFGYSTYVGNVKSTCSVFFLIYIITTFQNSQLHHFECSLPTFEHFIQLAQTFICLQNKMFFLGIKTLAHCIFQHLIIAKLQPLWMVQTHDCHKDRKAVVKWSTQSPLIKQG
jgi:hypothetical protein